MSASRTRQDHDASALRDWPRQSRSAWRVFKPVKQQHNSRNVDCCAFKSSYIIPLAGQSCQSLGRLCAVAWTSCLAHCMFCLHIGLLCLWSREANLPGYPIGDGHKHASTHYHTILVPMHLRNILGAAGGKQGLAYPVCYQQQQHKGTSSCHNNTYTLIASLTMPTSAFWSKLSPMPLLQYQASAMWLC